MIGVAAKALVQPPTQSLGKKLGGGQIDTRVFRKKGKEERKRAKNYARRAVLKTHNQVVCNTTLV
jgi:hypothetical protein